ncbi:unnamed protein product [Trichogramma brassicae]|uniref:Uncharacterized protein n=1 Tax=Trichogramma brassicae TaxID=86971 RepID=A0A6H5IWT0_9HYME|nr:unnamed protein product [Trichogramma brassicae]
MAEISAAITSSVPPKNSDPAATSVSVSTMCVSSSATPQSGRAESVSVPSVPSVSGLRIKSIIIVKPPRAPEKGVSHSSARQAQAHATLTSIPPRASALRLVPARHDPDTSELARPMSLEEAPEEEYCVSEPAVVASAPAVARAIGKPRFRVYRRARLTMPCTLAHAALHSLNLLISSQGPESTKSQLLGPKSHVSCYTLHTARLHHESRVTFRGFLNTQSLEGSANKDRIMVRQTTIISYLPMPDCRTPSPNHSQVYVTLPPRAGECEDPRRLV